MYSVACRVKEGDSVWEEQDSSIVGGTGWFFDCEGLLVLVSSGDVKWKRIEISMHLTICYSTVLGGIYHVAWQRLQVQGNNFHCVVLLDQSSMYSTWNPQ
jgi:hypothetical protein